MTNKIWRKPLHKRKIWKDLAIGVKIRYYLRPFVEHMLDIWFQPLPFPTILKVLQSFALVLTASLPIIYPIILVLLTYAECQLLLKHHFGIQLPKQCDLIRYSMEIFSFKVSDEAHAMFLKLYLERWRLITTALTSSVDYFRMACFLLLGFGE